ncbi:hypothetical protein PGT21_008195 [Puccinia graminis f. sp. tritici]|uniref:Uncharacterized protein n=1 Tax=Puccinia graminis f. sp. tritici TaxID=56615 RepID=A0A5B0QX57_PUCGR|nr:hypothetical protein PGT21_008195 [Puccinia graminis f. sp. tritici]
MAICVNEPETRPRLEQQTRREQKKTIHPRAVGFELAVATPESRASPTESSLTSLSIEIFKGSLLMTIGA